MSTSESMEQRKEAEAGPSMVIPVESLEDDEEEFWGPSDEDEEEFRGDALG